MGNQRHRLISAVTYKNLVKVFVDESIAVTNNPYLSHPTHFYRVMLHGVHYTPPPPPNITKHQVQDPISQKNSTGRGNMGHNTGNIGVTYRWIKFYSTADAGEIQKYHT